MDKGIGQGIGQITDNQKQFTAEQIVAAPLLLLLNNKNAADAEQIVAATTDIDEYADFWIKLFTKIHDFTNPEFGKFPTSITELVELYEKIKAGSTRAKQQLYLLGEIVIMIILSPIIIINKYQFIIGILCIIMLGVVYITCKNNYGFYIILTQIALWIVCVKVISYCIPKPLIDNVDTISI